MHSNFLLVFDRSYLIVGHTKNCQQKVGRKLKNVGKQYVP